LAFFIPLNPFSLFATLLFRRLLLSKDIATDGEKEGKEETGQIAG
jgi:hypothetical protein